MIACLCGGAIEFIYGLFIIITAVLTGLSRWHNKRCTCNGNKGAIPPPSTGHVNART